MLRTLLAALVAFVLFASTAAAQSIAITHCEVVSADKSYSATQVRPCTQTTAGRVKTDGVVGGPAADDAAASGNPVPVGGFYGVPPTYSIGDRTQLQSDTRGNTKVVLALPDSINFNAGMTAGADDSGNGAVALIEYNRANLFDGTNWDRTRQVINATDSTGTGIAAAGILAQLDDVSPGTVTENQFTNARLSTDRALLVQVVPGPTTSPATPQGASTSTTGAFAATTNETEAKATAGLVYGFAAYNNSATLAYLTFYNATAASVTCGTGQIATHAIPASVSGGVSVVQFPMPISHTTAITYCISTGLDGTGAVAANSGVAQVYYR